MTFQNHRTFLKISAIAGLVAPIFFISLIIVLSELENGYDHLADTISALGSVEGPRKLWFQMGGIITGFLVILFANALHDGINHGQGSKIGPGLIIMSGIGVIGVSLFLHQNIGNTDAPKPLTLVRILHLTFASLGVMGAGFSPFFLYNRFKYDPYWKEFGIYSLIAGFMSNLPSVVMSISLMTSTLVDLKGLLEKLAVLIPLLWLIPVSMKLIRKETLQV
jgi:hypothetical membrane protein